MFFADLNELQSQFQADETLETAWRKAVDKGFAFQSWFEAQGPIYCMAHYQGHVLTVRPSPEVYISASQVLAGLLGVPATLGIEAPPADPPYTPSSVAATLPVSPDPPEVPEAPAAATEAPRRGLIVRPGDQLVLAAPSAASAASAASATPASERSDTEEERPAPPGCPSPPPATASAASAASATPASEPEPEGFDLDEELATPDPQPDPSTSTQPLSEDEKAGLLAMLRELPGEQSRAAIVAFRKAFKVPATLKKSGDAITEVRHRVFLTRLIDEAEGIASS